MKQVEKFAEEYLDKFFHYADEYDYYPSEEEAFKAGFQKALDCVILYLKYKHRFGTTNEFDINFEEIQRIADTEIEE